MRGEILKAMLTLCCAALVLVGCSGKPDERDQGHKKVAATSGGGAGETTEAPTVPDEGALSPGRYSTGERFEPSLSFEIGEGWRVLPGPEPFSLRLGYVAPGREVAEGQAIRFLNVQEVFEPRKEDGEVSFEAEPAPVDTVSWFQGHPYLNTDKPEPVDVGGVSGERLDIEVSVPEGYRDNHGGGCVLPCVPLFRLDGSSVTHITEKGKDRFAVLEDVEGEMVVVIVSAPVVTFDEFSSRAQQVLDTVEWDGT